MIADEGTMAHLMALSQKGDKHAYTVLLGEASNWLQRYFRRKVPDAQLDDLVQEVLLAIHKKRASYDAARPFLPWLAAIARYRWVDHLRDADVPVRLEVIRGARHIMNSDQWDDVFTRSSQFFARNIGRPPG